MQIFYFVFFTGLVGLLTFILTRRKGDDSLAGYFLAGRALTGGVIAGSLLLTNLSTEQLVGLNGAAFKDGISVMAWEVVAAIALVVMALYFLPKFLRSGITTVPEFLEERYDRGTRTITAYIFIFAYAGILLPIVLYTGATGLNSMLDVEGLTGLTADQTLWMTVWLVGILGSMYAIFGGLKSVAVSDTINGFGLVIGGVLISVLGLKAVADGGSMAEGWRILQESNPEKFKSFGTEGQSVPWPTLFTGVLLLNLFYWCTNQQIIQRTFGARNLKEGQKGVLIAGCFKVLAPLILVLPGIIAFQLYCRYNHNGEQVSIDNVSAGEVTLLLRNPDGKAVVMTSVDETDVAGASNLAAAKQLVGEEVAIGDSSYTVIDALEAGVLVATDRHGETLTIRGQDVNDFVSLSSVDKAYGKLVGNVLPKSLVGFFAAVMIGAILSSFNSALNSTATLFSLGVYKGQINPAANDRTVIRAGMICGLAVAIVAMTVAPMLKGQESIFGYLQKMNGIYFIPIFAVVLAGLIHRRIPAWAAQVAVVGGVALIAIGYFVTPQFVERINEFHFLGIAFAILMAFLLAAGTFAPRAEPWTHEHSGDVDLTPWGGAIPVALLLVVVVLTIYLSFA